MLKKYTIPLNFKYNFFEHFYIQKECEKERTGSGEKAKWQSSHETSRLISLPRDNGSSEKDIKGWLRDVKTEQKKTRTDYIERGRERERKIKPFNPVRSFKTRKRPMCIIEKWFD